MIISTNKNILKFGDALLSTTWGVPVPPTPDIVTDGLICYLDAANPESYSGTGSTWLDLTEEGNDATISGSVTWTGDSFTLTGSTTTHIISSPFDIASDFTMFAASRYTVAGGGRVITGTSPSPNFLLGHHSGKTECMYVNAGPLGGPDDTNWRIYSGSGDLTADEYEFWINGSLHNTFTTGSGGINGFRIGSQSTGDETSDCEISFMCIYDRVLTASEQLQNYNAFKDRFGF